MKILKYPLGSSRLTLEIQGEPQEINNFEMSLENWGVCTSETWERIDDWHASARVSIKKLFQYFVNLEEMKFDPDRIITDRLNNLLTKRAEKRFNSIPEVERKPLWLLR